MTTLIGRLFAACKKLDGREFGWEDSDSLPVASRQFLLNYGWKQWMADSHAADQTGELSDGESRVRKCTRTRCWPHVMERHTVITTESGCRARNPPRLLPNCPKSPRHSTKPMPWSTKCGPSWLRPACR